MNHHVSVLFSLLSLSFALSIFLPSCAPLYNKQLFPLSLPAVSNNNEESKRSIGQRESHPLFATVSAPVRLEFPPVYLVSVSRTFIPLERFVVCPAGTCSFLILLSELTEPLSLAPFLLCLLLLLSDLRFSYRCLSSITCRLNALRKKQVIWKISFFLWIMYARNGLGQEYVGCDKVYYISRSSESLVFRNNSNLQNLLPNFITETRYGINWSTIILLN